MIKINYNLVMKEIENMGLIPYFQFYMANNQSLIIPYHNCNHMLQLLYHIIKAYRYDPKKLSTYDYVKLLLAGMYHDFNHSGGVLDDADNIVLAKKGLFNAIEKTSPLVSLDDIKDIYHIIDATQYPYIIDDKDLSYSQSIIRDADLLVRLSYDYFTQTLCGLKSELKIDDYIQLLNGDKSFLSKSFSSMRTQYGEDIVKTHHSSLVDYMEQISNMFIDGNVKRSNSV